jgi:hypothetical protein
VGGSRSSTGPSLDLQEEDGEGGERVAVIGRRHRRGWRWSQSRKKTARTSGKKTARAGNVWPSSAVIVVGAGGVGGSGEKRGGGGLLAS